MRRADRAPSVKVGNPSSGFYQGDALGLRLGEEFHHNRVQLISSQIGGVAAGLGPGWTVERLQRTAMDCIATGRIDVRPLVTHVVPAGDVAAAFALLDAGDPEVLQAVLDFRDQQS